VTKRFVCTAICVLLASCASERIVLLPEKDGKATAVVVRQGDREVLLDKPYAATELTRADPWSYQASEAEVSGRFGAALAAQPGRPTSFTLYFIEGSNELTAESKQVLEQVFAELKERKVVDIVVVGHTDTVGTDQANDRLAGQRADAIRDALINRGIASTDVVATGRGKRELLVPTADNVAEPRNRRVEIVIR
jgi:outer membrane protein OmpA-like peptidoglycan-associated protein